MKLFAPIEPNFWPDLAKIGTIAGSPCISDQHGSARGCISFFTKMCPPQKSEPLYPRPYILYAVSCAAMTVLMRRSALGGVEKHRGRPKTGESCSKLRGSARVGDALGLESLHKGDLMHCEGASGSDSKWNGRSARACAVRNGRHKRVSICTARQQLLQLICKLLGRQGRLARAKINCDTYTTCSTRQYKAG